MVDLVDQIVGNYRIDLLIGAGGMGQVYRAVHTELNRVVAIKVMWPNMAADPEFQRRFLGEARSASALSHPNIITIYDFNRRVPDGLLYLVMELMTEGSLGILFRRRLAGQQPLELVSGLDLVRQAADGLAYAHSRQMIHRDIKPDNLLLSPMTVRSKSGCPYTLKIGDFGLAKLAEESATASAITSGSAAYMSPEQCQGLPLDARSDLYSLGLVLYEIATGYPPYQMRTIADAVYKHVNTQPVRPSQVNPELPPHLEEIILRCLAKQPADRYATADELSLALAGVMAEVVAPAPARDEAKQPAKVADGPGRIYVSFSTGEKAELTAGEPTIVRLLVVNLRKIVDHFRALVEGVPAEWVSGNESELQLNPEGHGEIMLTITPTRAPASVSREYPVVVRVQSRAIPQDSGTAAGTWTVAPFYGSHLALDPNRANGIGSATFQVHLRNDGNTPVGYQLSADDGEIRELTYGFAQEQLRLRPGEDARVGLTVSVFPRPNGDEQRLSFRVMATPDAGEAPPPVVGTWFEQAPPPRPPPVVPDGAQPGWAPASAPPAGPPHSVMQPVAAPWFAPSPIPNAMPPQSMSAASQGPWIHASPTGMAAGEYRGETRQGTGQRAPIRVAAIIFAIIQIVLGILLLPPSAHWPVVLILVAFHLLLAVGIFKRRRLSAVIYFLYSIALLGLSALVFVAAAQSSSAVHLFADHVLVSGSRQRLFVGDGSLSTEFYVRIAYRTYAAFLLLLVGANVFSLAALRRVRR